jgi:hypothetical protein
MDFLSGNATWELALGASVVDRATDEIDNFSHPQFRGMPDFAFRSS